MLRLDESEINNKLVRDGFVINYEYGQGRDLIFDYEEMEMEMRKLVSSLCLFDTDNIPMLNYQFELYNENNSLITNIRRRINQTSLSNVDRAKFESLIVRMNRDEIVQCLGSLDHIFTYLCNIDDDVSDSSIQAFVEQHMNTNACLNEHIFRRPPFSTVPLIHIISLYEVIEEVAFDIVLRNHVKIELREAVLDEKEKNKFINQTFGKDNISPSLKSPLIWIRVLKRLLIRVLNANVDLEMPLQIYIERIDLWSGDISDFDLQTFELDEDILLKHTYCILNHLEEKTSIRNASITTVDNQQPTISSITTDNNMQILNTKTWYSATNQSLKKTTLVKPSNRSEQKLRV
jgi:hypothetical protein